jgi:hypothetical protein
VNENPFLERAKTVAAEDIRTQFHERGSARVAVDDLAMSVNQWRHLARTLGRELDRPVRTILTGGDLHALLQDWPRDDREAALHDAALRRAVNAAGLHPARDPE